MPIKISPIRHTESPRHTIYPSQNFNYPLPCQFNFAFTKICFERFVKGFLIYYTANITLQIRVLSIDDNVERIMSTLAIVRANTKRSQMIDVNGTEKDNNIIYITKFQGSFPYSLSNKGQFSGLGNFAKIHKRMNGYFFCCVR